MTGQEQTLFDPRKTERPVCESCGTAAKNLCRHDADISAGLKDPHSRRPKTCLNSAQLGPDDPLPEGF